MIHYSPLGGNVACGRSGSSLNSSDDAAQVSCKLCLRTLEKGASEPVRKTPSLAELRAAAKAEKAEEAEKAGQGAADAATPAKALEDAAEATRPLKVAKIAAEMAKPIASLSPRAEWRKRLEQLPGRNRLPRGVARQAFI